MRVRKDALALLLFFPLLGIAVGQGCGQFRLGEFGSSNWGSLFQGTEFMPSESSGLRKLTVREYDNTVASLFGDTEKIGTKNLPQDNFEPFDNFTDEAGAVSAVHIRSFESAADAAVTRLMADRSRRDRVLPCSPKSVNDTVCLKQIVDQMGLLAFRRPLTSEESTKYLELTDQFAKKSEDPWVGVEVLLKFLLQHPAFLYRWEVGEATDGNQTLYQLNDYEIASRLSYTLWGTTPDAELLQAASRGELSNKGTYLKIVDSMLEDERARKQIDFFHAAWFGYEALGDQSQLTRQMRQETRALLDRIIFDENRPWRDVLTSDETYITKELADHYGDGTPAPEGQAGWVRQPASSERKGLFGQGSFLAVGAKFGDTSPIQRGYSIRKNVFCEPIGAPPPGVDVDEPPGKDTPSVCKEDQHYASTMKAGTSCVSCHQKMDTIGFGLERYDALGAFRTREPDHPECQISGEGEVFGYGRFNGPAELAQVALQRDGAGVEKCLVERWVQLTFGKRSEEQRHEIVEKNYVAFKQTGKLKDLIRAFVSNDDFRYRRAGE